MARPRLIILIRHGQSEGNKNRDIHQTTPDHRVKLTPDGWAQAHEAGHRLRKLLRPDDTIQFFTSPYRRTRETTEGILSTLTSDDPEPSPYRLPHIKVYEEPRLREQDFGNFQPCSAEMSRMWNERADYGHFFYRIPNGESAADAYDRISGFNESLWRQFGDDDFPSICVLVTHGLMSRVFLMKWYHFTVEYFEDLRNIDHCEFVIMRKQDNGKYLLENKLRTWSELRRDRSSQVLKDNAKDDKEKNVKERFKLDKTISFVSTRRWGGCPDGCDHGIRNKSRHDLEASQGDGGGQQPPRHSDTNSSDEEDVERQQLAKAIKQSAEAAHGRSSVDGTPSPIKGHHLHLGRDFGGSYSGHASVASGSDSDNSEAEGPRRRRRVFLLHNEDEEGRHARAERLGDKPGSGDDDSGAREVDEIDEAEKEDRSIRGSVY